MRTAKNVKINEIYFGVYILTIMRQNNKKLITDVKLNFQYEK